RKLCEQPGAQRRVLFAQNAQSFPQQTDLELIDLPRPGHTHSDTQGSARELLRRPSLPRYARSLHERFSRLRVITGLRMSFAQRERQLSELFLVYFVLKLEDRSCALVVTRGFFVGQLAHGSFGRADCVINRLIGVACGRSLEEVVRQLRQVCVETVAIKLLKRLPNPTVKPHTARGADLVV